MLFRLTVILKFFRVFSIESETDATKIDVQVFMEAVPKNTCIDQIFLLKKSLMVFRFPNRKLRVYGGCLD